MEQSPLTFTLELTIGGKSDLILSGNITGPVADKKGNIYFIDDKKGILYSFDSKGNLRWKTGTVGRGPGDFNEPRGLVISNGFLYTANIHGIRIDKFNLMGELVSSTSLDEKKLAFKLVGFISDTLLVGGSMLLGELGTKVTVLNTADDLEMVSEFNITPPTKLQTPRFIAGGVGISIMDSLIAAGNIGKYRNSLFTVKGKKVKTVSRDFHKLMLPGFYKTEGSTGVSGFGSLSPPLNLKNGYYITTLSWPTNVEDPDRFTKKLFQSEGGVEVISKNAIDLYTSGGKLLYSLVSEGVAPKIGTTTYVDAEGNVYTKTNKPFPQIRRYQIIIEPPR